jgi:NAD(P)-dependent dehydrogenase (short-subunit alcohol dehydrogenase family)
MPARWTTADIPDQTGRAFLITGANAGIGYHQALHWPPRERRCGWEVASRSGTACERWWLWT